MTTVRLPPERAARRRIGFTLLELLILMAFLGTTFGALLVMMQQSKLERDRTVRRYQAMLLVTEAANRLRTLDTTETWDGYGPDDAGLRFPFSTVATADPFDSDSLSRADGTPATVEIELFVNETESRSELSLPADLTGDGLADRLDVSVDTDGDGEIDATTLPVMLQVEWSNVLGGQDQLRWPHFVVSQG